MTTIRNKKIYIVNEICRVQQIQFRVLNIQRKFSRFKQIHMQTDKYVLEGYEKVRKLLWCCPCTPLGNILLMQTIVYCSSYSHTLGELLANSFIHQKWQGRKL